MYTRIFGAARSAFSFLLCAGLVAARTYSPDEIKAESKKANDFFEHAFQQALDRSPELQSYLGIKKNYDQWDDDSDAHATENLALELQQLTELKRTITFDALDPETKVSYRLFVAQVNQDTEGYKWRFHSYPVNQLFGEQSSVPAFLINIHQIADLHDAQAYVARLNGIKPKFDTLITQLELRREKGIVPPRFVFPLVIASCQQLIAGEPFDSSGKKTALLEDFEGKLGGLKDIAPELKTRLLAEAKIALTTAVKPAYEALIAELQSLEKVATDDDGVWKFPEGQDYYNYALRRATTTTFTAGEIHALGLKEVDRIHAEMEAIKEKVGFKGDLAAFFKFMREDKQFYFPNTPEGKAAYLKRANEIIDHMRARLDDLFLRKPKAPLIVKPVEAFRERDTAGAFYEQPSLDGTRPGTYYVNLYDMTGQPKYEMEALAYHEGIPGHHMQIAIAQELEGVPMFRKVATDYTAYVEGWGLYCERLPREIGFYADPYADFGRLSMELWRAARLVVDTGIHAKKWTRQQTIDWLRANTPNSDRDILNETNRYIVLPGQATAYKIGMIKLIELRERAKQELGPKFDLREYHDVVLRDGAVPLDVLEENVRGWIASKK